MTSLLRHRISMLRLNPLAPFPSELPKGGDLRGQRQEGWRQEVLNLPANSKAPDCDVRQQLGGFPTQDVEGQREHHQAKGDNVVSIHPRTIPWDAPWDE